MIYLDHIGLSVSDLDAQARWYTAALDLTPSTPFQMEALGLRGVFMVDQTGWAIELLERRGSEPSSAAPDPNGALLTHGYGHLCLRVVDVDAVFAKLIAAGATERLAPRDSPEPGVRMAFVSDPEENLIELLDRPGPVGSTH